MENLKVIINNVIGTILGIHIMSSVCVAYFLLNMQMKISSWVIFKMSALGIFTILDMYGAIGKHLSSISW